MIIQKKPKRILDLIWEECGQSILKDIGGTDGWKDKPMLMSNGVKGTLRNWWNTLSIILILANKMDYKKKYEKAFAHAREIHRNEVEKRRDMEFIFPELKESEDERIRKGLIKAVSRTFEGNTLFGTDVTREEALAWLEKQGNKPQKTSIWKHWKDGIAGNGEGEPIYLIKYGRTYSLSSCLGFECDYIELSELDKLLSEKQSEQKPADKVEPRFKVGDWITDKSGLEQQVLDFRTGIYTCTYNSFTTDCESNYHLWTIQDAKNGDVLAYNDGSLTIFHYRLSGLDAGLYMSHVLLIDKIELKQTCAINNVHPATKEQRDQLEKAMADTGYTFNFEKKELKKIEQKPAYNDALNKIEYHSGELAFEDDGLQNS